MSSDADASASLPLYARFSRRVRAILVDWIIAMIVIFGALSLAVMVQSDNFSRSLGFSVIAALLLYEPVLVSLTGGTLGHYLTNLRVVDNRSGGNVSFLKACARLVIKSVLGLYSFVILAATRRNQAVHDLLTRSTVQIRDLARALPGQYVTERRELAAADMPSRWRRVAVTCVFLVLTFVLLAVAMATMIAAGILSKACVDNNHCSAGQKIISLAAGLAWLAAMAFVIVLGWRGKLFGARRG